MKRYKGIQDQDQDIEQRISYCFGYDNSDQNQGNQDSQCRSTFQQHSFANGTKMQKQNQGTEQNIFHISQTLKLSSGQGINFLWSENQQSTAQNRQNQNLELQDSNTFFSKRRLEKKEQQILYYESIEKKINENCPVSSLSINLCQSELKQQTITQFLSELQRRIHQINMNLNKIVQNFKQIQIVLKDKQSNQYSHQQKRLNSRLRIGSNQSIEQKQNNCQPVIIKGLKNRSQQMIIFLLIKIGYLSQEQVLNLQIEKIHDNLFTYLIKQAKFNYYVQNNDKYFNDSKLSNNSKEFSLNSNQDKQVCSQKFDDLRYSLDKDSIWQKSKFAQRNFHNDEDSEKFSEQSQKQVSILSSFQRKSILNPFQNSINNDRVVFPHPNFIFRTKDIPKSNFDAESQFVEHQKFITDEVISFDNTQLCRSQIQSKQKQLQLSSIFRNSSKSLFLIKDNQNLKFDEHDENCSPSYLFMKENIFHLNEQFPNKPSELLTVEKDIQEKASIIQNVKVLGTNYSFLNKENDISGKQNKAFNKLRSLLQPLNISKPEKSKCVQIYKFTPTKRLILPLFEIHKNKIRKRVHV